ncbi:hypothetical protein A4H97_15345 [Niastella yeongjuensis]|uniref:Outer membrane protein beta-barrel domain-containing protein n=1 Tax=Niastella yeongjuensis TaxID=354355 RepID=A0A1V9E4Y0_9BACT|nr:hypothetical protein [Niastella yeongjuensis]OQP40975.1 hypothetical protein A4H97_15345 [Niastella yeongjuensis]SEO96087.1 hypothetical protein SAMN05660816_03981 [Niastella yeongjuensis]
MRKYAVLIIVSLVAGAVYSQETRICGYGNYVFDDRVESYYSSTNYFNGVIEGGGMWGVGLEFKVHDEYGLEILYQRQDTKATVHYYDLTSVGDKNGDVDLGVNWIMACGTRYLTEKRSLEPFAGFMLGVAILDGTNPDNGNKQSATKFAWGFRLGTNVLVSERIGFRFQAQIQSATQAAGGGLYFGTGGAGVGVTTYSSMTQFVLGGGVFVRFGHPDPKPTRHP